MISRDNDKKFVLPRATVIKEAYTLLRRAYGPQGWWPLIHYLGPNQTKTNKEQGYHPGKYDFPRTDDERFEICLGAILTQNTSWTSVERALRNIDKKRALCAQGIAAMRINALKKAIKPAGYFNQKAKKIKGFTRFYRKLDGRTPTRDELLGVWGIGPETADSILLYAYGVPTFVVDAYTRRVFNHLGIVKEDAQYDAIKDLFEKSLRKNARIFQEYHALIVTHAKRHYSKKPCGMSCTIASALDL